MENQVDRFAPLIIDPLSNVLIIRHAAVSRDDEEILKGLLKPMSKSISNHIAGLWAIMKIISRISPIVCR